MMRNEEIFAAVRASLEGRTVKNALLIPPDFTRFHSNAGLIAGEYYRLLTERGAQVDVLPALGTRRSARSSGRKCTRPFPMKR